MATINKSKTVPSTRNIGKQQHDLQEHQCTVHTMYLETTADNKNNNTAHCRTHEYTWKITADQQKHHCSVHTKAGKQKYGQQ